MNVVGKTVLRIDEDPVDPEYGGDDEGVVLIHFTDGTALRIEGSSYDPVSQHLEELDQAAVRRRQLRVMGQREKARLRRLQRQEWLSLSCDERVLRRAHAEARMSTEHRAMRSLMESMAETTFRQIHSPLWGPRPATEVRRPCRACRETACENAPIEVIPAQQGFGGFSSIMAVPGSTFPA